MNNRRASIKDVAKLAGVSTATVSHVLNKTRFVSEEVTGKVLSALKETGYQSNHIARALRRNKTFTIGVIIPDIINPFFSNLINNIELTLNREGYNIILCHSRDDLTRELENFRTLRSLAVDGIIVAPASPTFDYASLDVYGQTPVVFVDRRPNLPEYSGVFYNSYDICRYAIKELIHSGHRRIGCMLGEIRFSATHDRLKGYIEALERSGIPVREEYILTAPTTVESGYQNMELLLKNTDVTSVFVANSRMCIGAMRYLNEQRIPVPGKIAMIGFAAGEWAEISSPPLTTVREPISDMGIATANLLLERLKDPAGQPKQIQLDAYLTRRSSY